MTHLHACLPLSLQKMLDLYMYPHILDCDNTNGRKDSATAAYALLQDIPKYR